MSAGTALTALLLKAPAKINLTLRIVSRRADGYHEISSIMRAVSLYDEVEIVLRSGQAGGTGRTVSQGDEPKGDGSFGMPAIRVRADAEGVPEGPENLAYRAAEAAFSAWGGGLPDFAEQAEGNGGDVSAAWASPGLALDITLKKNIPVAAGLAGGSSDAAAVLLGLAKMLWADRRQDSGKPTVSGSGGKPTAGLCNAGEQDGVAEPKLADIAALGAGFGADVPFCVYACAAANPGLGYAGAGAALAEGIGERISPLYAQGKARVLLVKPAAGIKAKEAYALFDAGGTAAGVEGTVAGVSDNDLEAACADAWPVVGETLYALKKICAEEGMAGVKVQLSGSGPTVFAYFEGEEVGCVNNPGSQKNSSYDPQVKGQGGGGSSCPEASERVYARAKEAFPGMFVCLAETI